MKEKTSIVELVGVVAGGVRGHELVAWRRSGGEVAVKAGRGIVGMEGQLSMDADAEGGEHVDWASPHLRRRVGAAVEGFQSQGRSHGGVDPGEDAGAVVEGIL